MALKIRLRRMGRKKAPHYRIVIAESSMPRDGRFVATIGHYNPTTQPVTLKVDRDKAATWMAKGAVPTETVRSLLRMADSAPAQTTVRAVASAVKGAAATAGRAAKGAAGKVADAAQDAAAKVADVAQDAAAKVADVASDAAAAVADAAGSVVDAVKDAAEAVVDKVAGGDAETETAEAATAEAAAAETAEPEAPAVDAEVSDAVETPVNAQITDEVAPAEEAAPAEGEEPAQS